jgi:hypothetical protein
MSVFDASHMRGTLSLSDSPSEELPFLDQAIIYFE